MKRLVSTILLIGMLFSLSLGGLSEENASQDISSEDCASFVACFEEFCKEYFAEKSTGNESAIVNVDEFEQEILTLPPKEAYSEYVKKCALIFAGMSSNLYDITTGLYHHQKQGAVVIADDILTHKGMIAKSDEFSKLISARKAYHAFPAFSALLTVLVANKPLTPEEYLHVDQYIANVSKEMQQGYNTLTNFCEGNDKRGYFDIWEELEDIYWSDEYYTLTYFASVL